MFFVFDAESNTKKLIWVNLKTFKLMVVQSSYYWTQRPLATRGMHTSAGIAMYSSAVRVLIRIGRATIGFETSSNRSQTQWFANMSSPGYNNSMFKMLSISPCCVCVFLSTWRNYPWSSFTRRATTLAQFTTKRKHTKEHSNWIRCNRFLQENWWLMFSAPDSLKFNRIMYGKFTLLWCIRLLLTWAEGYRLCWRSLFCKNKPFGRTFIASELSLCSYACVVIRMFYFLKKQLEKR